MLEKIVKDYFSFSRRERVAVIILVVLIIIIALLPNFIPDEGKELDKVEAENLRLQTAGLQSSKSDNESANDKAGSYTHSREPSFEHKPLKEEKLSQKATLFYFDPNEIPGEGWKKLGLSDKTISTIHNYISKGGRFKTREDIKKIYGLTEDDARRLMPYVKIAAPDAISKPEHEQTIHSRNQYTTDHYKDKEPFSPKLIDLNDADTSELIALPGIGSKLAERILRFREKLGGFYSVDQVSEVYALPDSTFQKIKSRLTIKNPAVPSININLVDANELKLHPYIKWQLAAAIIEYRKQHGNYEKLEDLHKVDLISDEVYRKIVPYLKID